MLPESFMRNMDANRASTFCEALRQWITAFEGEVDQQHEGGARLVNFGPAITFRLESIGFVELDDGSIGLTFRAPDRGDMRVCLDRADAVRLLNLIWDAYEGGPRRVFFRRRHVRLP